MADMSTDERLFPIQGGGFVRWTDAERAYDYYARRYGRSQSLERLAERGGFGWTEYQCFRRGMEPGDSHYRIVARVAEDVYTDLIIARERAERAEAEVERLSAKVVEIEETLVDALNDDRLTRP